MSPRGLRRLFAVAAISALAVLCLSVRPFGTTFAIFDGETENAGSAFAVNWVDPPADASAMVSGDDVVLTWTPGPGSHVSGQEIDGVDNGASSDCSGVDYGSDPLATLAAGASSYTDTNRAVDSSGDWFCYAVVSTLGTWRAQTTAEIELP